MTVTITCDWCAKPVEDPDEYVALDRRSGREDGRYELFHFHDNDCFASAARLIRDHASWAEMGAALPTWHGDELDTPAPPEPAADPETQAFIGPRANSPKRRTNLIRARKMQGLTLADVGVRLGVEENTVRIWEKGTAEIPDACKRALSDLFGVSVALLLEEC